MVLYKVSRLKDTVFVAIVRHKDNGRYSFINLTKEHICPCQFDTVEDAVEDLEKYKRIGKIISYEGPLDCITVGKTTKNG